MATTDADMALQDCGYKKLFRQLMAKAARIWNLTSRSTKAADTAFEIVGHRFQVPCVTRWNSYYDSVKKIISSEAELTDLCKALNLPSFLHSEIQFLKEYIVVMAPMAASLDILQGEQQCTLGYVLPTLTVLKKKLGQTTSRHVRPLQLSLLQGLNKRFGSLFTDKSFLLAAISHPKFKIAWCDDPAIRAQCTQLLENAILNTDNDITLDTPDATSSSVGLHSDIDSAQCSDDFFDFTNADASSQKHLLYGT